MLPKNNPDCFPGLFFQVFEEPCFRATLHGFGFYGSRGSEIYGKTTKKHISKPTLEKTEPEPCFSCKNPDLIFLGKNVSFWGPGEGGK